MRLVLLNRDSEVAIVDSPTEIPGSTVKVLAKGRDTRHFFLKRDGTQP